MFAEFSLHKTVQKQPQPAEIVAKFAYRLHIKPSSESRDVRFLLKIFVSKGKQQATKISRKHEDCVLSTKKLFFEPVIFKSGVKGFDNEYTTKARACECMKGERAKGLQCIRQVQCHENTGTIPFVRKEVCW